MVLNFPANPLLPTERHPALWQSNLCNSSPCFLRDLLRLMSGDVAKWLERKREMQQSLREEADMGSDGSCSLAVSEGEGT